MATPDELAQSAARAARRRAERENAAVGGIQPDAEETPDAEHFRREYEKAQGNDPGPEDPASISEVVAPESPHRGEDFGEDVPRDGDGHSMAADADVKATAEDAQEEQAEEDEEARKRSQRAKKAAETRKKNAEAEEKG